MFRGTSDTSGIPGDSPVLGFNEPDICVAGQSSCMPLDAVMNAWMDKAVPLLRQGRRVGSPAAAGNTVEYLCKFFEACNARAGCIKPSFITMHAYVSTADALKNYVTSVHNAFNMPIWLTEFSCHSFGGQPQPTSKQQVHDFMGATTKWLDNQPWVERYSWFGAGQGGDMGGVNAYCRLQNDDGGLTAVGWQYVFKRHN
ncbi:hypothetical protein QFC20_007700 [Naganishia adeliensis]|uniref:Uncharacterized protein n=1 Tax=Naganishia adeliensis TaxID=92952 RepID=A0ACC2UWA5_9TREE|nr:hypothetical protein QFC20_007700 [Naganishia adeliensis]